MLHIHLRAEVTAAISNATISQGQKVVEQGGSLNWALVCDKISVLCTEWSVSAEEWGNQLA